MAKNWLKETLWDFTRITLSLGAVAITWVPLMDYMHQQALPTFILEIPIFWTAEMLVTKGVMKLLKLNKPG